MKENRYNEAISSNMTEDYSLNLYTYKNSQKLRYGYTTGSCAAAAAKAATIMLLSHKSITSVNLMTPKGILLTLPVLHTTKKEDSITCCIKKDSGDDPDVTNGIHVYAKVTKTTGNTITLEGGIGVGRVTKEGLDCPVGGPAINTVPRQMILKEVENIAEELDYPGGLLVEISIPEGVEIAKKTFNPRLGIVGGISILGTSGIVEPMSEAALVDTIKVEMKVLKAKGITNLLITPGNYGEDFSKEHYSFDLANSLKCSNYIGETIDLAGELGFQGLLFIGHIGKFIKLAGGIMNTHSKYADARMEIMTAYACLSGADSNTVKNIMNSITTDEALDYLEEANLIVETMKRITERVHFHLTNRAPNSLLIGAILFSNKHGFLGETENVQTLIKQLER